MANSYKKQPFFYWAHGRAIEDKILANRTFRRKTKILLKNYNDYTVLPNRLKEISDVWVWKVDGPKYYWAKADPKYMRK
jgi:hypothetical protein